MTEVPPRAIAMRRTVTAMTTAQMGRMMTPTPAEHQLYSDEDINTIVTPIAPTHTYTGPIPRARACQLNYQVLPFLRNDSNIHENMMLPKLDTFFSYK